MATGIENTYWLCIAWDNLHKINYIYLCFVSGDISWKKLLWNIYVHCLCGFTIMSTYTYCKCKLTVIIIQFSSVTKSCWLFVTPWDCSTPSFPVHHELLEFTQTHVHRVGDAIQPSHPPSSPSPPAPNPPSIRVFSSESTLCMRWPKYWSFSFSIRERILNS